MRVVHKFSKAEDEIIKANAAKLTTKEIAALLDRPHSSVTCRVKYLKLKTFEDLEGEIWKLSVVDRHLKYYVSNRGRICRDMWRLKLPSKTKLNPPLNNTQYYHFHSGRDSFRKNHRLHREIGRLFLREPLPNEQINHINGNGLDNRLENLEWVTPSKNLQAGVDTGRYSFVKLNYTIVSEIRLLNFSTVKKAQAYLKEKYQIEVGWQCVYDALRGATWIRECSSTSA